MSQICQSFTDGQLAFIVAKRRDGQSFNKIATALKKQYGLTATKDAVQKVYARHAHLFEVDDSVADIKALKDIARTKRNSSLTAKENRTILQSLNDRDDLLDQLSELVETLPKLAVLPPPPVADKNKRDMTVEMMISDVHVGKKTPTFNAEICRLRIRKLVSTLLQEIERKEAHYNVTRVILALIGDLIENAMMHGKESAVNCEFDNAEQIRMAIEIIYTEVIVPLGNTGRKIDAVCISGNHDRAEEKPTYNDPGKASFCWVIYKVLKMLADQAGYTNIKWTIPEGVYATLDVYGDTILYEHADRIKGGNDKKSYASHIVKRSAQVGKVIKGVRVGHWHEYSCLDNGAVVVNASVPGQDSYAEVNGYNSIPGQAINFYVKTKNRDNSFFYSFLVQLGGAA